MSGARAKTQLSSVFQCRRGAHVVRPPAESPTRTEQQLLENLAARRYKLRAVPLSGSACGLLGSLPCEAVLQAAGQRRGADGDPRARAARARTRARAGSMRRR